MDKLLGNRYRLVEPLGHGGMATVFRARDELLGRDVAIKVFHTAEAQSGRIDGELAVLASLDHHALVQLIDAGSETDEYGRANRYIVMALVNGTDLHVHLQSRARLSARHIAEIGYDIAEALDYMHARRVIHRDIKPSNILLVDYRDGSARARAKLTDFGIALADDRERLTAQGVTTGTAGYLSPEQASGGEVTTASDVYSLGLVLLQCFTRHLEFPGSVVESAVARLERDPVVPAELPELWRRLLLAMTDRNPHNRPQRHDLVAALRQVVIAESGRHKGDALEPLFPDEALRTAALVRTTILDTLPNEALDRVTAMAARLFSAPIAIVSVVDHDRTWFRSHYGEAVDQIARQVDLSSSPTPSTGPVIVEDGRTDDRTRANPLVTGPLGLRFYVGVPLRRANGAVIGTLSVLDVVPGTATEADVANLEDLAALVVNQLELRQLSLQTTVEMTAPGS
ncbi:GAF domain-containing serine/threonine-protein kinase [Subtercola boreus]|uniref:GAF domain-containing serine/threonine-protein kinase n=1 Tax=Subtercola boreus TaxID=120213 RepID=UPI002482517A|nr:GAF domain-containing serine/threonine-protein kinase [Subtercola boreus]